MRGFNSCTQNDGDTSHINHTLWISDIRYVETPACNPVKSAAWNFPVHRMIVNALPEDVTCTACLKLLEV